MRPYYSSLLKLRRKHIDILEHVSLPMNSQRVDSCVHDWEQNLREAPQKEAASVALYAACFTET